MDFFSPFIQPNSLCAPILWAKLINPKMGSSLIMYIDNFYNEFHLNCS